ncbi:hexose kinase [Actinomadura miaoliensis]|uniref:1-phosphofructokinase family hexose kinase n=1 Tax=Actinomadura miaoliensis TaxID=430685 RepID=A0ABP7X2G2_9ACTN
MIVTVTPNLALDVTYHVDALRPARMHRVRSVGRRAGGKGVNVARVLRRLGADVLVVGPCGGPSGEAARADLAACGLAERLVPVRGDTRRTLAVVDAAAGDATLFNEPGPAVSPGEWQRLRAVYEESLPGAAAVLAGSLPVGAPEDAYAVLAASAARHGVPAVVDADGPPLLAGLAGRPALVKPNADELARVSGRADPLAAAGWLRARGAQAVVCSLGADGLLAVTAEGCWRAVPPRRLAGNPVGAGDAAVAALTYGMVRGQPWPDRLRAAAALSAAAVVAAVAGEFDAVAYERFLPEVAVREVRRRPGRGAGRAESKGGRP